MNNPALGLFPEKNNIDLPADRNIDEESISGDSIDTNVLREVVQKYTLDEFNEHLLNDKFWVSSEYYKIKDGDYQRDVDDFLLYNEQVQNETRLRNKLLTLDGDLKVYREIPDHLYAGEEDTVYSGRRLGNLFRWRTGKRSVLSRVNSNGTEIIDNVDGSARPAPQIQRKLKVRHVQMIALDACVGVGLFLNTGRALSMSGGLGTLLGFVFSGSFVVAAMVSFTELSTLIPVASGFSGLASRFVEDAFGFAMGVSYWFTFTMTMPSEIIASTIMLSFYPSLVSPGAVAGFVTLFLIMIIVINLLDVRIYGEFNYVTGLFKVAVMIMMILVMIIINVGGVKEGYIGFRYWNATHPNPLVTFGPFRPTFDLKDVGYGALNGIGGSIGKFLQILLAVVTSVYSYNGSEMGFVAAGEARNPRKSIPSSTNRVFVRVILFYIVSVFVMSLNIYAGDPRLLRYYQNSHAPQTTKILDKTGLTPKYDCHSISNSSQANGNKSPWVLALQSVGLCTFSAVFNAFLVIFGVTAGVASLYASSRTLYSMSIQGKCPKVFSKCWQNGVPWVSVLFSGSFGLLAYSATDLNSSSNFLVLSNLASSSIALIWAGMCFSFLRFYFALKHRPDIVSRDDPAYPYRSPFQPYLAVYGLVCLSLTSLFTGFTVFLDHSWNTRIFFGSYGGIGLFAACYVSYKMVRSSKYQRVDQLDLDSGRREMDRMIWDEDIDYHHSTKEYISRIISWLF